MATQLSRAATDGTLNEVIKDTTGQAIVDELQLLRTAVKPDASDIAYDSNTTVKGKINEKVNKNGDTMTGDLTVDKSSPRFNADNNAVTLSTATNNGVLSTTYCGLSIRDSNNSQIGLLENIAGTDGTISTRVTAKNMDTSGNAVSNTLQVIARKNGNMDYSVSDPSAFRNAIEAQKNILSNTATVTLSTTKYGTFYYADTTPTVATSRIISIVVTSSSGNNFAQCVMTASGVIRVFGDYSGGSVTIKYFYI